MDKIIGVTVGTPMRVPDWNQEDPTKADYIKNKPVVVSEDYVDEAKSILADLRSANASSKNLAQTLYNITNNAEVILANLEFAIGNSDTVK